MGGRTRQDRNVVIWKLIIAVQQDIIGSHDDGSNGTYSLEYPILYTIDAYNYFEQGGSSAASTTSTSTTASN